MKLRGIGIVVLVCLAAMPAFANSWSGVLVDSKCYEAEERSVSPNDRFNHAYQDTDVEVQVCTPSQKTRSFSIVGHGGFGVRLNPFGNELATAIVRQTGKKHLVKVTVTGEMSKNAIDVGSISVAQ